MRLKLLFIFFLAFVTQNINAQKLLKGIIKDEQGHPLADASIKLHSTKNYTYYNGSDGSFGLPTQLSVDTIYVTVGGYEVLKQAIKANEYTTLILKLLPDVIKTRKKTLASKTKGLDVDRSILYETPSGESYTSLLENEFIKTNKNPQTGFAINVDRAAYSNIRRYINNNMTVPMDAVRIEEMLNYFDFRDSADINAKQVVCKSNLTTCPWNKNTNLLFINTSFPKINLDTVPASNLVFLIDVSGSMERPNRLPLLQAAFKMLVDNLRSKDVVTIVTYGGGVDEVLPPTSGRYKSQIKNVIDSLYAEGDTPGSNAIKIAYAAAKKAFIRGGNNRVILATDGDFNVGQTTDKELEELITIERQSGVYLTCIGVGMGNYKDSKLETLAKKGNGNFAYLDDVQEAEKVLVKEFTKTIYAVAKDAFVDVKFDATAVKQYRLIGYDNKKDAATDEGSVMAGGEVGSGHSAMAVFEIEFNKTTATTIAEINVSYKKTSQDSTPQIISLPVQFTKAINIDSAQSKYKIATGLCMYGALLRASKFAKGYDLLDVEDMIASAIKTGNYLHQDLLTLIKKTDAIYHINKRKRKKKKK